MENVLEEKKRNEGREGRERARKREEKRLILKEERETERMIEREKMKRERV